MKAIRKAVELAAVLTVCLTIGAAQTGIDKPIEPESIGVFYYLDSSTQTLKRLPQEDFRRHSSGFSSVTTSIRVSGESSSLRVAKGDATFVFKVFKDEEASKAKLFQFSVKGSEREYELGKWKRRDYTPNVGLSVDIAKFGTSSFKLTPGTPLSPGEYALTLGPTVFTFGVGAQ